MFFWSLCTPKIIYMLITMVQEPIKFLKERYQEGIKKEEKAAFSFTNLRGMREEGCNGERNQSWVRITRTPS